MRSKSIADELTWTLLLVLEVKLAQQGFFIVNLNSEITVILRDVLHWLFLFNLKPISNCLLFRL